MRDPSGLPITMALHRIELSFVCVRRLFRHRRECGLGKAVVYFCVGIWKANSDSKHPEFGCRSEDRSHQCAGYPMFAHARVPADETAENKVVGA